MPTKWNILNWFHFVNSISSTGEQNLSAEWSSVVNNAYKVLLSPIKRAEYLLQLFDVHITEDNSDVDADFLMEMMERNEEVRFEKKNRIENNFVD